MIATKKDIERLETLITEQNDRMTCLHSSVELLHEKLSTLIKRTEQKVVTQDDETQYEQELALSRFKK